MSNRGDMNLFVVCWDNLSDCNRVTKDVEMYQPDCVVIVGIPRHHAKKVLQQKWTKRFFVSKERKSVTLSRPNPRGVRITLVLSVHPFTSEEWISPTAPPTDEPIIDQEFEVEKAPKVDVTHCAEICIPLGGWKALQSPIELLQEYQLEYDKVSTFTIVAAADENKCPLEALKEIFSPERLENSVIFVSKDEDKLNVQTQLRWWKEIKTDWDEKKTKLITLVSDPIHC